MEMNSNPGRCLHVLIVDRDKSTRKLLQTLFLSAGHTVTCARGPAEALELVKFTAPDAIFSALVFESMDGFELCRQLRAMPETACKFIVALTGLWSTGVEEAVLSAGFDRYLFKPVNMQFLLSLLDTVKKP